MKINSQLTKGLLFTWWAVASIIIGGIIRVELVTPEYEATFHIASLVYAFGWLISVMNHFMFNDKY